MGHLRCYSVGCKEVSEDETEDKEINNRCWYDLPVDDDINL